MASPRRASRGAVTERAVPLDAALRAQPGETRACPQQSSGKSRPAPVEPVDDALAASDEVLFNGSAARVLTCPTLLLGKPRFD